MRGSARPLSLASLSIAVLVFVVSRVAKILEKLL